MNKFKSLKEQLNVTGRNFFLFPMWCLVLMSLNKNKDMSKSEIYKFIYHNFNCGNYNYIHKVIDILEKYKIVVVKDKRVSLTVKGQSISDKVLSLFFEVDNVKSK